MGFGWGGGIPVDGSWIHGMWTRKQKAEAAQQRGGGGGGERQTHSLPRLSTRRRPAWHGARFLFNRVPALRVRVCVRAPEPPGCMNPPWRLARPLQGVGVRREQGGRMGFWVRSVCWGDLLFLPAASATLHGYH